MTHFLIVAIPDILLAISIMTRLPECPKELPEPMNGLLSRIAEAWVRSDTRPRIAATVSRQWDMLIEEWIASSKLPLFIRRWGRGEARGQIVLHASGRKLVPSDNTLASWVFVQAFGGVCPSLREIGSLVERRELPIALALKPAERVLAEFRGLRGGFENPNVLGWRVCHKQSVGIRLRGALADLPIAELERHFRQFISPSNMFLVPKALGGLGELTHMTEVMKGQE